MVMDLFRFTDRVGWFTEDHTALLRRIRKYNCIKRELFIVEDTRYNLKKLIEWGYVKCENNQVKLTYLGRFKLNARNANA